MLIMVQCFSRIYNYNCIYICIPEGHTLPSTLTDDFPDTNSIFRYIIYNVLLLDFLAVLLYKFSDDLIDKFIFDGGECWSKSFSILISHSSINYMSVDRVKIKNRMRIKVKRCFSM